MYPHQYHRVVSALEEYFGEITDDHLLSMILNPHLTINGFEDLKQLEGKKGEELFDRAKKILKKNMIRLAKSVEPGINNLDANNTERMYIRLYLNLRTHIAHNILRCFLLPEYYPKADQMESFLGQN